MKRPLLKQLNWRGTGLVAMVALCWVAGPSLSSAQPPAATPFPSLLVMKPVAKLGSEAGLENSGLVASRKHPGVYWGLNDSGNKPSLYPILADGTDFLRPNGSRSTGVSLTGATNVDWEDIALDSAGQIIVADTGNNQNNRAEVVLYVLTEPNPADTCAAVQKRYRVAFPDRPSHAKPSNRHNFDCEAIFTIDETIYLLTKHRADLNTRLYGLENPNPDALNTLKFLDEFAIGGMVTAADATPDGKRLGILTYQAVWIFERETLEQSFFEGKIRQGAILSPQAEAICWKNDETLAITDEKLGWLFHVSPEAIPRLR